MVWNDTGVKPKVRRYKDRKFAALHANICIRCDSEHLSDFVVCWSCVRPYHERIASYYGRYGYTR